MKSAILSGGDGGGSAILRLAAQHGAEAEKPRDPGKLLAPEPRPKRVTIEAIVNGYKVMWSGSDYGRDKEAHASTWAKAAKIAKAYMEGKAPDEKKAADADAEEENGEPPEEEASEDESDEDESDEDESGEEK